MVTDLIVKIAVPEERRRNPKFQETSKNAHFRILISITETLHFFEIVHANIVYTQPVH